MVPVGRDARLSGANVRYPAAAQQAVDTRSSEALNLAALVQAPILVAPEVLVDAEARRTGDSPEAARLRKARVAPPMTFGVELGE